VRSDGVRKTEQIWLIFAVSIAALYILALVFLGANMDVIFDIEG